MSNSQKDQKAILAKLKIQALNQMQLDAADAINNRNEVVLLSPTGTGKTLAFLLPTIAQLDPKVKGVQALIIVPSRELAIQIEQVIREMGSGYKTNAVFGGRSGSKDRIELRHAPAILVGTPGRVADHIRNETFTTNTIHTLILDEFDKSLEVGFEEDMMEIVESLHVVKKKILTSATQKVKVPAFMNLTNAKYLNFLKEGKSELELKVVISPFESKLNTLLKLIKNIGKGNGIVFCNFKDSIKTVSDYLNDNKISHSCFYGGLEQIDRERALIKFRNGSSKLLVATDLAARGIDVPELDFIIHYELPTRPDEYTHRNGRTARMHSDGTAYVIQWKKEELPNFITDFQIQELDAEKELIDSKWDTLYISGGRKDKISKGDIAGLFFKQGKLSKNELGVIELKQDCSYVSVINTKTNHLIKQLNNSRLKKKKVRISLLD